MNLSLSGKVGLRAILYYVVTTVLAVILGVVLVVSIKPGDSVAGDHDVEEVDRKNVTTEDTLMDLVRNCFPPELDPGNHGAVPHSPHLPGSRQRKIIN